MPNLNLSRFHVFIGETGAIDCYPGRLIASTFLYDLPNLDLQGLDRKIDRAIDGLDSDRKAKVAEVLQAIGFDPKILEKDYRKNRAERLACLYFSVVVSGFLPQVIGFKDFGLYFDPRLGRRVTKELIELAETYDKAIFLSTQNVGCLDGLDLDDDFQRLFVVNYNMENIPIAHRQKSPKPLEGQEPVELSEAYLRGYLGGLSKKF